MDHLGLDYLTREWFGQRLKQAILERGMSQKGLERLSGINSKSIRSYIRGDAFPPLDSFAKLCKALNYSADYLLGLSGPKAFEGEEPLSDETMAVRSTFSTMNDEQKKAFLQFLKTIPSEKK